MMALGILSAFAVVIVVIASIAIPIVHFITVPIGPFIAGFTGSAVARATNGQVLIFGLIVTGLSALPVIGVIIWAVVSSEPVLGLRSDGAIIALALLLLPFIWFSVTFGALLNFLMRRRMAKSGQG